jgi:hypothetical protein
LLQEQPKGKVVNANEFVTWSHSKRNQDQKCFCGQYACIGFNYKFGMLELLCFKHYQERIKECHKEKEHTEVKEADQKSQLNLL